MFLFGTTHRWGVREKYGSQISIYYLHPYMVYERPQCEAVMMVCAVGQKHASLQYLSSLCLINFISTFFYFHSLWAHCYAHLFYLYIATKYENTGKIFSSGVLEVKTGKNLIFVSRHILQQDTTISFPATLCIAPECESAGDEEMPGIQCDQEEKENLNKSAQVLLPGNNQETDAYISLYNLYTVHWIT